MRVRLTTGATTASSATASCFFYVRDSVLAEFGGHGALDIVEVEEPSHGSLLPFLYVVCTRPGPHV